MRSAPIAGALGDPGALHSPGRRALATAAAATAAWGIADRNWSGWWRHPDGDYGWVGPLFWPFAYDDLYDYAIWGYGPPFWDYGYADLYAAVFAPYDYEELAGYLPRLAEAGPNGEAPPSASSGKAGAPTGELARMCGESGQDAIQLPTDQFRQAASLDDAQRAALDDLANALKKAAQMIKAACPTDVALTAPDRLAAMQQRIEAMIGAVETVRPPLDKLYGLLTDEQKARFAALAEEQHKTAAGTTPSAPLAESCEAAQRNVKPWPSAEIERRLRPSDQLRQKLSALEDAAAKAQSELQASCQPTNAVTPPARLAAADDRLHTMLNAVKEARTALDDVYANLSDEQKAQLEAIGRESIAERHGSRHHAHT